jgi:hypothetical protein
MTAWSTLGEVGAILAAGCVAWWQIREVANARYLESSLAILRYLDNENFGRTRWFLYEHQEELKTFLHPKDPFTWKLKQEWDATFQALNKDRTPKVDFYSIRSLIHALDNIAFLIESGHISYDKILPNMMENHFRIANSLLGDYIRYSLKMEGFLFQAPPGYTPSFGQNFLRLMDIIQSGHQPRRGLARTFHLARTRLEAFEEKLDRLSSQPSLEERIEALEQALENVKHPPPV